MIVKTISQRIFALKLNEADEIFIENHSHFCHIEAMPSQFFLIHSAYHFHTHSHAIASHSAYLSLFYFAIYEIPS